MGEPSKVYEPRLVESRVYEAWREAGCFAPTDVGAPYTCVLPPPNVTGRLHMGHALTATIEDTMVRWHRMRGFAALWLPGTDHAGIATQMMVERKLAKEGTNRETLGRAAFLERMWAWKADHGGIIDRQHEALGASLDWSRYRFTLDEVSSKAVREAFVRLHEQGLVYRDFRLINWDTASCTALSDLEVEHETVQGQLWHLRYPIEDSDEVLVVATTRPETMLGDTGVAVHPDDPRYRHLVGKHVILPLVGRRIPIVADGILVDMSFGTGAVKVTPAHDFNDFETGKRHGLELVQVIDFAGKIMAPAPERFRGLSVAEARTAVVAALEAEGAVAETRPHELTLARSDRTKVVIEPLPSTQWFLDVEHMAAAAIEAVRSGRTVILPEHRTNDYYRWMENIHDWCISRQLWWGHRIPAWHCGKCREITVSREDPSACSHCGSNEITQDEDVLDTWFSSGLWPLTMLGWPDADRSDPKSDLARFYPTSLMETGWDILFFWVARMMMFGLHFTGEVPFHTVFLHSMVLGEDKKKMSKTRLNVVDPVELIGEHGADALRFYLATMAGQELGIVFSRARVQGYRNFCNKLWNASRFVQMNLEGADLERWRQKVLTDQDTTSLGTADRWILGRAVEVCDEVDRQLRGFRIDLAAHAAYQFVWHELCDWYIELSKPRLRAEAPADTRLATQGTLATVFDLVLRLLHPIVPFITEEIWQILPRAPSSARFLMMAEYPEVLERVEDRVTRMRGPIESTKSFVATPEAMLARLDVELLIDLVGTIRMLKAEAKLSPATKVEVIARSDDQATRDRLRRITEAASPLGRITALDVRDTNTPLPHPSASAVVRGVEIALPLAGLVDLDAERARLTKEVAKKSGQLAALETKLTNEGFLAKAPAEVVETERGRLAALRDELAKESAMLVRLGGET